MTMQENIMDKQHETQLEKLRNVIRLKKFADEKTIVNELLTASELTEKQRQNIANLSKKLITQYRNQSNKENITSKLLQEFPLNKNEGAAIMTLAESLLRIPDSSTANEVIADKLHQGDWFNQLNWKKNFLINTANFALGIAKSFLPKPLHLHSTGFGTLFYKISAPIILNFAKISVKLISQSFVYAETIDKALKPNKNKKETLSFDLLGEGARNYLDADFYFNNYYQALIKLGEFKKNNTNSQHSISIKLTALHPRFDHFQFEEIKQELYQKLFKILDKAKEYDIAISIDAEEMSRQEITLEVFEYLLLHPSLKNYSKLGFVLQAYSKRAVNIVDWLVELCRSNQKKINVRLVKGAYWDQEIKVSQEQGHIDYPVFTTKYNTDLSYQICTQKLLAASDCIFPQFATHNIYSIFTIFSLAEKKPFELQRLQGMGEILYSNLKNILKNTEFETNFPIRIYAPVGKHKQLLPYLVRRLIENGANNGFINQLMNPEIEINQLVKDPITSAKLNPLKRHSQILLPEDILKKEHGSRKAALGIDFENLSELKTLKTSLEYVSNKSWVAGPIINGEEYTNPELANIYQQNPLIEERITISSPVDNKTLGFCYFASTELATIAVKSAEKAKKQWQSISVNDRAEMLIKAAEILQQKKYFLMALTSLEAGKTLTDIETEIREAIDFLRYYANQEIYHYKSNQNPKGTFLCISPWNFPIAIFLGQIAAALSTGNTVIAKPAESTSIIAYECIKCLYQAGIPKSALQFLPGSGKKLGPYLAAQPNIQGIAFTGSTHTAWNIFQHINERKNLTEEPVSFIAETGGLNAMIVDSSSLLEQVTDDVIRSAFYSAGQRCSCLRVIYVEENIAEGFIAMLTGAMDSMRIGVPWDLSTDIGPVIHQTAKFSIQIHIDKLKAKNQLIKAMDVPKELRNGSFIGPHLFEISHINELTEETFGPVLHLIRYKKEQLKTILLEIKETGYGLTMGVHSRSQKTIQTVIKASSVGNIYINRNMVGAVVGTQPFGGNGFSGTGFKAGGPHYLNRFKKTLIDSYNGDTHVKNNDDKNYLEQNKFNFNEKNNIVFINTVVKQRINLFTTIKNEIDKDKLIPFEEKQLINKLIDQSIDLAEKELLAPTFLPGPNGESNQLFLQAKGLFLCISEKKATLTLQDNLIELVVNQWVRSLIAGNNLIVHLDFENKILDYLAIIFAKNFQSEEFQYKKNDNLKQLITLKTISGISYVGNHIFTAWIQKARSEKNLPLISFVINAEMPKTILPYCHEITLTNNHMVNGGNLELLNYSE